MRKMAQQRGFTPVIAALQADKGLCVTPITPLSLVLVVTLLFPPTELLNATCLAEAVSVMANLMSSGSEIHF